jgi:hypothetical protein
MLPSTISAREHSNVGPTKETVDNSRSTTTVAQRTASALYQARLPKDEIRLLTVLPSDDFNAPVECELHQFNNSTAPEYEGLSYAWGDAIDKSAVTCNGISVNVTANLCNALKRFRDPSVSKTIWVDALCLNQADVGEKNIHIPLVGRVYSQATNTVIFLGETSHEEAAAAAHGIMAVSGMLDALRAEAGIARDDFGNDVMDILQDKVLAQPRLDVSWNAIETIFDAPWFKRIWCVQEIVLARDILRPSYAIYGHARLRHRCINQVGVCLYIGMDMGSPFSVDINIPSCVGGFQCLSGDEQLDNPLFEYLGALKFHKATDPRDMVYGVLGVLRQQGSFDSADIVVDYARSLEEVYTDAAAAIIKQSRDLRVLEDISHLGSDALDSPFPSWVPRWDRGRENRDLPSGFLEKYKVKFAGSSLSPKVEGRRLLVYGTRDGAVTNTLSLSNDDLDASISQCWPNMAESLGDHEECWMMARTLSTGYAVFPESFFDVSTEGRNQFLADFCDFLHNRQHRYVNRSALPCPAHKLAIDGNTYTGSRERYTQHLVYAREGRVLFQMADGHCGLGPDCLQEGDVIVALLGGSSPYALRQKGEDWCYLGPVYVDGLMDGTYFRQQYDSGMPVQRFTLT